MEIIGEGQKKIIMIIKIFEKGKDYETRFKR